MANPSFVVEPEVIRPATDEYKGFGECLPSNVMTKAASSPFSITMHENDNVAIVANDGLPELSYPMHDRDVLVTACGRICMHRKKVNISTVLAGQKLGIKEVDEGIWLVSFMHYDLGYIDLEQKTLQPLDNPFGARMSPMS
jgi:hypothetical protein